MSTSHQNVKQIALGLVRRGFVRLVLTDRHDTRVRRLIVTAKSDRFWAARDADDAAAIAKWFSVLTRPELATLNELLARLSTSLENQQTTSDDPESVMTSAHSGSAHPDWTCSWRSMWRKGSPRGPCPDLGTSRGARAFREAVPLDAGSGPAARGMACERIGRRSGDEATDDAQAVRAHPAAGVARSRTHARRSHRSSPPVGRPVSDRETFRGLTQFRRPCRPRPLQLVTDERDADTRCESDRRVS